MKIAVMWFGAAAIGFIEQVKNTGIDYLQDDLSLTIYPNPAGNKVTLQWSAPRNIEEIAIKSTNGHPLKTFTNLSGKTQELDLSGLSGGVYFLIIEGPSQTYERKLIVK